MFIDLTHAYAKDVPFDFFLIFHHLLNQLIHSVEPCLLALSDPSITGVVLLYLSYNVVELIKNKISSNACQAQVIFLLVYVDVIYVPKHCALILLPDSLNVLQQNFHLLTVHACQPQTRHSHFENNRSCNWGCSSFCLWRRTNAFGCVRNCISF